MILLTVANDMHMLLIYLIYKCILNFSSLDIIIKFSTLLPSTKLFCPENIMPSRCEVVGVLFQSQCLWFETGASSDHTHWNSHLSWSQQSSVPRTHVPGPWICRALAICCRNLFRSLIAWQCMREWWFWTSVRAFRVCNLCFNNSYVFLNGLVLFIHWFYQGWQAGGFIEGGLQW